MAATGPPPTAGAVVPRLAFAVLDAARLEHALAPTLRFALRIEAAGGQAVRSILLDTQIQIAVRRRTYDAREQERLYELFGAPGDWGTTLHTLLLARTTLVVPPFEGSTVVDLTVPCTYDMDVVASRYFDGLADGEVPLELLFSGAIFYAGAGGMLQTVRIPWDHEAEYRLPVAVWRETMDRHFPGAAWVRLGRESFDQLKAYRSKRALATWDDAVDALLDRGA
jgi:hypothetical protein